MLIQRAVVAGDAHNGLMATGVVAGRLTDLPSCADLLIRIEAEALEASVEPNVAGDGPPTGNEPHTDRFVEFSRLVKVYPTPKGPQTVVDGFDLKIRKGEFISVIGHSGCGKSTVLTMAAGLNDISGGGIVLDNLVMFTYGKEPRSLPSPLAQAPLEIAGNNLGVYPLQLLIPVVGLALAAVLHTLSRRTRWGVAMLAVVQNRSAARLMGIPIRRAVAIAFALSTLFAGVAGVLIAPLFNVHSDMGTLFGLKAFAVAILGGITSAWGVMIAGLLFGVVEAMITSTLGSGYTQIITFALVIVALAWRPNGLFGRAEVKKV